MKKKINNCLVFISDIKTNIDINGNIIDSNDNNVEMNEFNYQIILNKVKKLFIFSLGDKKFYVLCE